MHNKFVVFFSKTTKPSADERQTQTGKRRSLSNLLSVDPLTTKCRQSQIETPLSGASLSAISSAIAKIKHVQHMLAPLTTHCTLHRNISVVKNIGLKVFHFWLSILRSVCTCETIVSSSY